MPTKPDLRGVFELDHSRLDADARAARYRQRADYLRDQAEQISYPSDRDRLLVLATLYDRLADNITDLFR